MSEILAPAGNPDMLKAAVINGADAVYLGAEKFSARAKAENFGGEGLKSAIDYAHLFGVKVYVAINTVIKNSELDEAIRTAEEALTCKADALILQDLGLSELIRKKFPRAVLHASTQIGIHNLEGAIIAKKLGFSRIILSRETLFEDIKKIKQNVDIELECFVQGALCIAFSGNCYFSSFASGYSGNRGKCMQLCRKFYSAELFGEKKSGYLLSAKDLMLAKRIKQLSEVVDCFKIEGRLRRPEYVAESVRVYKKALQGEVSESDIASLKRVFNRGDYTEGHLFTPTNKVLDINICAHKGLKVGTVKSVIGKRAKLSCKLGSGDGVKFLRGGKEVGSASITSGGDQTGFEGDVRSGDEVFITTDSAFNKEVLSRTRKLPTKVTADFDNKLFAVSCNGVTASVVCNELQPAQNKPLTIEDVKDNFNRSDCFFVEDVKLIGKNSFLFRAAFNEVRRRLYEQLRLEIIQKYEQNMPYFQNNYQVMSDIISGDIDKFLNGKTIFQVESPDQIKDYMEVIAVNPRDYSELDAFGPYMERALLNLPVIARGKDIDVLKKAIKLPFAGFIVNNLYGLELTKGRNVILGYGMNIVNDVLNVKKVYSVESDGIMNNGYTYAQGNVPLMNFCHCEKKELSNGCENCHGYDITLVYEGRRFYLRRYKVYYCYSQLLNCADLDLKSNPPLSFIDLSYKRTGQTTKGNYGRGLK